MEERKEEAKEAPQEEQRGEEGRGEVPPRKAMGAGGWLAALVAVVVVLAVALAWFSVQWRQAREEARRVRERMRAMCLQSIASAASDLERAAAQARALNLGEAISYIERASKKVREAASISDVELKSGLVDVQGELNKLPEEVRREIQRAAERAASRIEKLAKKVKLAAGGAGPPVGPGGAE